jgi:hypothetical protein
MDVLTRPFLPFPSTGKAYGLGYFSDVLKQPACPGGEKIGLNQRKLFKS